MEKYEEAPQTGIPADALIANPSQPVVRLRGSLPLYNRFGLSHVFADAAKMTENRCRMDP